MKYDELCGLPYESLLVQLKELLDSYDELRNFSYNYADNKGKSLVTCKITTESNTLELNEDWKN